MIGKELEDAAMSEAMLYVSLGKVETLIGELEFTFVVSGAGDAHVQVSATNGGL